MKIQVVMKNNNDIHSSIPFAVIYCGGLGPRYSFLHGPQLEKILKWISIDGIAGQALKKVTEERK